MPQQGVSRNPKGDPFALVVSAESKAEYRPLALDPKWKKNLNAQCWLWKDHTSVTEAAQITELAALHRPHFIAKCGNTYSSEWFFSKLWHCLNVAPEVFDAAESWVEFCDWIPAVLVGDTRPGNVKRGVCAAGHKAMYCQEWGGLPDAEFLSLLDPRMAALRDRLYTEAFPSDVKAGDLCPECGEAAVVNEEGCRKCYACGFSEC